MQNLSDDPQGIPAQPARDLLEPSLDRTAPMAGFALHALGADELDLRPKTGGFGVIASSVKTKAAHGAAPFDCSTLKRWDGI